MKMITVGILLFNEVEVLDFAGPYEVFSIAKKDDIKLFNVVTIGENTERLEARNGLKIVPDYHFKNHPKLEILIIPGGYGAEEIEIKNRNLLDWIKQQSNQVKILASVCTGALLLAEIGVLDNKEATTHWMDLDRLEKNYPKVKVVRGVKYVDQHEIITSGGISAGINMSFYIIKKLTDTKTVIDLAKRMEYDIDVF
jgi:transcriptional regulator GlxA family with amidase domain